MPRRRSEYRRSRRRSSSRAWNDLTGPDSCKEVMSPEPESKTRPEAGSPRAQLLKPRRDGIRMGNVHRGIVPTNTQAECNVFNYRHIGNTNQLK